MNELVVDWSDILIGDFWIDNELRLRSLRRVSDVECLRFWIVVSIDSQIDAKGDSCCEIYA